MKLDVLESDADRPWYADGLKFTCSQCGNCCTGAPGFVWISDEEVARLARHLEMTETEVRENYCRRIGQRTSLKERKTPQGLFDCIFLKEIKTTAADGLPSVKRVCGIYPVRPLQCRTWPFWEGNLTSRENWEASAKRCHGMNHGKRTFTREQADALKNATDWPDDPPTSFQGSPRRDGR
jgi:Fe-S-cluster containining protein